MKYCLTLVLLSAVCLFFDGCLKDSVTKRYVYFKPVYETKTLARANMKSGVAQDIVSPGKLFVKDNYIFLNELDRGVHIIDYSNPSNPKNIAFVAIPGNEEIAVQGNYLFANEYSDLVTLDIADPLNIKVADTDANVFPERYYTADANNVIVDWIRVDTTIKSNDLDWWQKEYVMVPEFASVPGAAGQLATSPAQAGIGGSMASLTLMNNRLYTVSAHSLNIYNVENSANPAFVATVNAGFDIETIYPFKNQLFLGSQEGMYIFNVSDPDAPYEAGTFVHAQACDPVIADGDYAYVTLHSGNSCGSVNENDMHVLNVTDPANATLIKTYPFYSPHGLAKDGNTLFVCDGKAGLKILNAGNPLNITPLSSIVGIETYDVIAVNKTAIVSAKEGLYLVDYANPAHAQVVGKLLINK